MNRKDGGLLLLLAVSGGFAGGRLATRPALVEPVLAQGGRAAVVEAEEFRLVEKDGRACGRFYVDPNGRPGLVLYDKHGEVRAVLGMLASGSPHLALSDKDGNVRVAVAVWSDARSGLFLTDGDGTARASLAEQADGHPSLTISDRTGRTRAVAGAVSLDGINASQLRARSESSLALFDNTGKVLWSAP